MSEFEKIIVTAIVGIIAAFIGYQLRRLVERYDARRAQEEIYDLIGAFGDELESTGGGDYLSHLGVWYYQELADILKEIAKKEHRALGGEATYLLMRLIGGLQWSAQSPETTKGRYEMDEINKDVCAVMIALSERRYPNDPFKRRKMVGKWKERRALMTEGIGFEMPVMPARPDTFKAEQAPD